MGGGSYYVLPWKTSTTQNPYSNPFGGYPMKDDSALLYDVYMVYAENLTAPIVKRISVIAKTRDEAKLKSGLMKEVDNKWDVDYLTFIVNQIGTINYKPKPQEVKVIKETKE